MLNLLTLHSILTIDLISDRRNANRYAVNVVCSTQPADITAHAVQLGSPQGADPNAPVRLVISAIRRVPLAETPHSVQKAASDARRRKVVRGSLSKILLPTVTSYFSPSCSESQTASEIVAVFTVAEWQLIHMARKPTVPDRPPPGVRGMDVDMPALLQ